MKIKLAVLAVLLVSVFALPLAMAGPPPDAGAPRDAATVVTSDAGSAAVGPTLPIKIDPVTGAVTATPGSSVADVSTAAREVVTDLRAGHWRLAMAAVLALIMGLGVRFGPKLFGSSDRRKAIVVMILATLAVAFASILTSTTVSLTMITGAIALAFTAVGGRQWLSRFLWPRDGETQWLVWLQPFLGVKPGSDTGGGSGVASVTATGKP